MLLKFQKKSIEEQQTLKKVEKIGKAANNPEIKQLLIQNIQMKILLKRCKKQEDRQEVRKSSQRLMKV